MKNTVNDERTTEKNKTDIEMQTFLLAYLTAKVQQTFFLAYLTAEKKHSYWSISQPQKPRGNSTNPWTVRARVT